MPLPGLTLGLVVRYEYVWSRNANTADKDHPACVVGTYFNAAKQADIVVYLPISHTPPGEGDIGIELSDHAKRVAGLDARRQWVLVSECNIDDWPFAIRQIPGRAGVFSYGYLPPKTFDKVRDQFVALYRAKQVKQVRR